MTISPLRALLAATSIFCASCATSRPMTAFEFRAANDAGDRQCPEGKAVEPVLPHDWSRWGRTAERVGYGPPYDVVYRMPDGRHVTWCAWTKFVWANQVAALAQGKAPSLDVYNEMRRAALAAHRAPIEREAQLLSEADQRAHRETWDRKVAEERRATEEAALSRMREEDLARAELASPAEPSPEPTLAARSSRQEFTSSDIPAPAAEGGISIAGTLRALREAKGVEAIIAVCNARFLLMHSSIPTPSEDQALAAAEASA
ncbi:MAG: hypothetical protein JWN04_5091, partial [Myxococcaceae bacterium]|nr:hypothetical protein [Myxococcaceae bacterium]